MRRPYGFPLPIGVFGLLVMMAALASAGPALAANCGGATPCSCGDTVVASRTLVCGADAVTTTICPADGLIVAGGAALNLGGCFIRGSGVGVGLTIASDLVTIRNGRVTGFGQGIATSPLMKTEVSVSQVVLQRNQGDCLVIDGFLSTVNANRCAQSAGRGFVISGDENTVTLNWAQRNGGVGMEVDGADHIVSQNRSSYNNGGGFTVKGKLHEVTANYATDNAENGFTVSAEDTLLEVNRSSYSTGWGIEDTTTGTGTQGTANIYVKNRCTGRGLGLSTPPGLCK